MACLQHAAAAPAEHRAASRAEWLQDFFSFSMYRERNLATLGATTAAQ